jgi:asparagine synthase (glutamine-hydrolysing)
MKGTLRHRGPDDAGVKINAKVGLGHVRHSVIDTSTLAKQPMCNVEATVWISFNGVLCGHEELRAGLEKEGYRFGSMSDTEVVIHLYQKYGLDFVHHLRGQFALALWDENEERLVLARDRIGIKPLYWTRLGGGNIAFASEIKALLEHPEVDRKVDEHALCDYLSLFYVPTPRTLFDGIFKLEPGTLMIWKDGEIRQEKYWRLPVERTGVKDSGRALERFFELLDESVRLRMRSDVPVGAYLNGDAASAAVVASMNRHSRRPVRTFYMKNLPEAASLMPDVVRHFDEPFGNPAALFRFALAKETSKHVDVVLCSDGAEEIFGAYPSSLSHFGNSGLWDMGMPHALELRFPFLDHKLIEFVAPLPMDVKVFLRNRLQARYASPRRNPDTPDDEPWKYHALKVLECWKRIYLG